MVYWEAQNALSLTILAISPFNFHPYRKNYKLIFFPQLFGKNVIYHILRSFLSVELKLILIDCKFALGSKNVIITNQFSPI